MRLTFHHTPERQAGDFGRLQPTQASQQDDADQDDGGLNTPQMQISFPSTGTRFSTVTNLKRQQVEVLVPVIGLDHQLDAQGVQGTADCVDPDHRAAHPPLCMRHLGLAHAIIQRRLMDGDEGGEGTRDEVPSRRARRC